MKISMLVCTAVAVMPMIASAQTTPNSNYLMAQQPDVEPDSDSRQENWERRPENREDFRERHYYDRNSEGPDYRGNEDSYELKERESKVKISDGAFGPKSPEDGFTKGRQNNVPSNTTVVDVPVVSDSVGKTPNGLGGGPGPSSNGMRERIILFGDVHFHRTSYGPKPIGMPPREQQLPKEVVNESEVNKESYEKAPAVEDIKRTENTAKEFYSHLSPNERAELFGQSPINAVNSELDARWEKLSVEAKYALIADLKPMSSAAQVFYALTQTSGAPLEVGTLPQMAREKLLQAMTRNGVPFVRIPPRNPAEMNTMTRNGRPTILIPPGQPGPVNPGNGGIGKSQLEALPKYNPGEYVDSRGLSARDRIRMEAVDPKERAARARVVP